MHTKNRTSNGRHEAMALSDPTIRALRHADQVIHEAERTDVFAVYDACRAAVGAITALDDFYVALIQEDDRRISYPYLFSNGRYAETGTVTYGPSGVVAWVVASRKPYRYQDDQGALLNRGVRFGDGEPSADAVIVPMLAEDGVVGLVGALSDTPAVMTDEVVAAMTWLAAVVLDRIRAASPSRRLNLGAVYPELQDTGRAGTLMAVNHAASALTALAAEIELLDDGNDVETRVAALSRRCFEAAGCPGHAAREAMTTSGRTETDDPIRSKALAPGARRRRPRDRPGRRSRERRDRSHARHRHRDRQDPHGLGAGKAGTRASERAALARPMRSGRPGGPNRLTSDHSRISMAWASRSRSMYGSP